MCAYLICFSSIFLFRERQQKKRREILNNLVKLAINSAQIKKSTKQVKF